MTCPKCGKEFYGKFLVNEVNVDLYSLSARAYGTCKECDTTWEWTYYLDPDDEDSCHSKLSEFRYC